MDLEINLSLQFPLQLPIHVRMLDGLPKVLAGGLPITPINLVLKQKQQERGATLASLDTYVRAAQLYLEFCAHRQQSLIGISNEEFIWFKHALLGDPFASASGPFVTLSGTRGRRTADLMLTLLYSLATDIAERYDTTFDWLRYKGEVGRVKGTSPSSSSLIKTRRTHSIRWIPRKMLGLPDEQFVRLLRDAHVRGKFHTTACYLRRNWVISSLREALRVRYSEKWELENPLVNMEFDSFHRSGECVRIRA